MALHFHPPKFHNRAIFFLLKNMHCKINYILLIFITLKKENKTMLNQFLKLLTIIACKKNECKTVGDF